MMLLFAQTGSSAAATGATGFLLLMVGFVVFMAASLWKVFDKAGEPGWAALVPIYNMVVLLKVVGRPTWWVGLLLFVPFVFIVVAVDLAKSFGRSAAFGVLLALVPIIGFPMLAFSEDRYVGPAT